MTPKRVPVLRFVAWAATVHAVAFAAWISLRPSKPNAPPTSSADSPDVEIQLARRREPIGITRPTPLSDAQLRQCEALAGRIEVWLAAHAAESDWAGAYSLRVSDGLSGCVVQLAPEIGFVTCYWSDVVTDDPTSCLELAWGRVERLDGALWLTPAVACNVSMSLDASPLVPLDCGERRYLVRADQLAQFVEMLQSGHEPGDDRSGRHLLRRGDESKSLGSTIEVPDAYRVLWKKSVHARITGIQQPIDGIFETFRKTTIALDVGVAEGVRVGDRFWLDAHREPSLCARVLAVGEHECAALLRQRKDDRVVPRVGLTLSRLPNLAGRFERGSVARFDGPSSIWYQDQD